MRFTGKLFRNGEAILDPATGDIWEKTSPSGIKEWGGYIGPVGGFSVAGDCELYMDDGRAGPVTIESHRLSPEHSVGVPFKGAGLLRWCSKRPTEKS